MLTRWFSDNMIKHFRDCLHFSYIEGQEFLQEFGDGMAR